LNAGVWFRRTRFVISSPDPQQTSPHSGRKSTHPTVQIPQASSDHGWGRANRPVIDVSWENALNYVQWLNRMVGTTGDKLVPYRLPTEAEWEYSARAGTMTARWWGDTIGENNTVCDGCGSRWDNTETAPVGSFRPNQFGLFDMLGNVMQWTMDCWRDTHAGAPNDSELIIGPMDKCEKRVTKGSNWGFSSGTVRSAFRWPIETADQLNTSSGVGFRVLRVMTEESLDTSQLQEPDKHVDVQ
jgi:formylglycine-generating enzyme required for sulfatase activity